MTDTAMRRVPELLAPAGGPESLRAAVANGADAVYLGLESLNARRGAENFTMSSLGEVTGYAHLRSTRVYLTANVVVLADEMNGALDLVARAWEAGVDAVILQDLGLLRLVRRILPEVRVHASTQIDAHNAATVEVLAGMGVSRVTLAREMSIAQIASLTAESRVELESFVHGSLCFCYSGQCLMSSMIGARSANRGMCAQPCRLPYDLVSETGEVAQAPGKYLLSPKDLAGIGLLPDLIRSGVSALKIEGRMKSPEYVATVVRVYRAALDRAAADPEAFTVTEAEWDLLSEAFSRGFSEAYLAGASDDSMMSFTRPNNRGVPVGRVASVAQGSAVVSLDRALESGDRLEFRTGSGRFTQAAGPMRLDGAIVNAAPPGSRVVLDVEGATRTGDRVFRVVNAALLEAARRTYTGAEESRPTPAAFSVRLVRGQEAVVTVAAAGLAATATGPIVEKALTRPITAEDVAGHVGRLGGTPYAADSWRIDLDPGVGISFSVLHALRRRALESLDAQRLAPWTGRSLPRAPRADPPSGRATSAPDVPLVVVAVSDIEVARACIDAGADRVLLAMPVRDAPPELPAGVEPLLPRVAPVEEFAAMAARWKDASRVTTGNLGLMAVLAGGGREGAPVVSADWGLNAVQEWTVEALAELGAAMVWASPEVSGRQLKRMVEGSRVPVGVLVYGRIELMVSQHCVLQTAGACSHACARCERRGKRWFLQDRKDYLFPVTTDDTGRSHIYNSVPLDLSRALAEVVDSGVAAVRMELHQEGPAEAARLVSALRSRLMAAAAGGRPPEEPIVSPATSGHFFRGVK